MQSERMGGSEKKHVTKQQHRIQLQILSEKKANVVLASFVDSSGLKQFKPLKHV